MAELRLNRLTHEVKGFSCGNNSIEQQIEDAYFLCLLEILYTFEAVADNGDVLGYVGLKMHRIHQEDVGEDADIGRPFRYYAVEIKYLGIDKSMQGHGIGSMIMRLLLRSLRDYHLFIPYRYVYVDALKERVSWLQTMGFKNMERYDTNQATIPMFIDLNPNKAKLDEYMGE